MKKILLIIGIIFIANVLNFNATVRAVDAPVDTSNLSAEDQQTLNNYLQKKKQEKEMQNSKKQMVEADTNNTNPDPVQQKANTAALSKWATALITIYIVTLVLFLITLILSIIALSRWLKKN
mgnify:CR=1 FL=1